MTQQQEIVRLRKLMDNMDSEIRQLKTRLERRATNCTVCVLRHHCMRRCDLGRKNNE
ncbi:hypothetical protein [uncultured Pseudodesulfovibrio sp.]|uniref:hypothetical protein n=1 Tax=uncultured Pseudodesulfovibrio sp. TaxID=2035858 RepID=UPI0029C79856|nr:hypothetical protein [uncultured Pseudodesulfovibrio sp.]